MGADAIFFYVLGAIAILASLLVVAQRSPIYSVLLLIGSFVALAGLYVLLDAPFLAVIQIIIYAGAIMVLFLFVVMLLNAPYELPQGGAGSKGGPPSPDASATGYGGTTFAMKDDGRRSAEVAVAPRLMRRRGVRALGAFIAVGLIVELLWAFSRALGTGQAAAPAGDGAAISSVHAIGQVLYTDYAFAFEVTSILIIVAMVGAVVLAKREI